MCNEALDLAKSLIGDAVDDLSEMAETRGEETKTATIARSASSAARMEVDTGVLAAAWSLVCGIITASSRLSADHELVEALYKLVCDSLEAVPHVLTTESVRWMLGDSHPAGLYSTLAGFASPLSTSKSQEEENIPIILQAINSAWRWRGLLLPLRAMQAFITSFRRHCLADKETREKLNHLLSLGLNCLIQNTNRKGVGGEEGLRMMMESATAAIAPLLDGGKEGLGSVVEALKVHGWGGLGFPPVVAGSTHKCAALLWMICVSQSRRALLLGRSVYTRCLLLFATARPRIQVIPSAPHSIELCYYHARRRDAGHCSP